MNPLYNPTHIGNTPENISVLISALANHARNTGANYLSMDTEFHGGDYPDNIISHMTLHMPGTTVVLEFFSPNHIQAMSKAWAENNMDQFTYYTHFGQGDLLLLNRAKCKVDKIFDTGILANHLSLQNTGMKDLCREYNLVQEVKSYWQMLKEVIPPMIIDQYIKGTSVIQAYNLLAVLEDKRPIMLNYCGQDGVLGYLLGEHLRNEVVPKLYNQHTQKIIYEAQFKAATYLAYHNSRGYPIDEQSLLHTIEETQKEVDQLELAGRTMVRDAMGWDRPQMDGAMALLYDKPDKKAAPIEPEYVDISKTPKRIRLTSEGVWVSMDEVESPSEDNEKADINDQNPEAGVLSEPEPVRSESGDLSQAGTGLGGGSMGDGLPQPPGTSSDAEAEEETGTGASG